MIEAYSLASAQDTPKKQAKPRPRRLVRKWPPTAKLLRFNIQRSGSIRDLLRRLNVRYSGRSFRRIKDLCLEYGLGQPLCQQLKYPFNLMTAIAGVSKLSPCQRELFKAIGYGYGRKEIASMLNKSEKTVAGIAKDVMRKLGVFNDTQIAITYIRHRKMNRRLPQL